MQTILHITDIHFGWEGSNPSRLADRVVCLDGLIAELRKIDARWKPTIICLSGDIGWRGAKADYQAARAWLDQLLGVCGLDYSKLIVCAGNHDLDRGIGKKLPRPQLAKEADDVLEVPIAPHHELPFAEYISFCKKVGIPAFTFGDAESYLVGARTVNGIRFLALNSAWFCRDDEDKGKLFVGLPHLRYMEGSRQLSLIEAAKATDLTIALVHHPAEWLHTDEQHAGNTRPNTIDYLANRAHILLTGHTHGEVRRPDRIADRALHFTGGSAYAGASHFNSFRLIQVTDGEVSDRAFEFDPRSAEQRWIPREADSRPLLSSPGGNVSVPHFPRIDPSQLRLACRARAAKQIELKSRLIRRDGPLPTTIPRPVALRVSQQHNEFTEGRRLARPKDSEHVMPFYEAVRQSRRTLLLGDLGMGKSTLAASLTIETIDKSQSAIAIFVPAKALKIAGQFTSRDLLASVEDYVGAEIWSSAPKEHLLQQLDSGGELLLVIDGLDELSRELAARVLRQASALVDNWPTIQIVATARPVELLGFSFSDWQIVYTVALDDDAKRLFIEQELMADGGPAERNKERADELFRALKDSSTLDKLASSPLAIRLICSRIKKPASESAPTLGELLFDLLMERLDGWRRRDDKPTLFPHFEAAFSASEDKASFLAILAEPVVQGRQLTLDEAKELLVQAGRSMGDGKIHQLATEAITFFESAGLLTVGDTIDFPIQPIAEICAAFGKYQQGPAAGNVAPPWAKTEWRVASFVAAIARKRGQLDRWRESLRQYLEMLLAEPGFVPAGCYVVVESRDPNLARATILLLDAGGFRPLTAFYDDRKASARHIAETLVLAGDVGFDWYFKEYLDPIYPVPNAGAAIVGEVFSEWAALVRTALSPAQKINLGRLVEPYLATGEGHFYGVLNVLSVLVPEAFKIPDRIWYLSRVLDSRLFQAAATNLLRAARDDEATRDVAEGVVLHRASESISAARLWLEWHQRADPPPTVVRLALRSSVREEEAASVESFCRECVQRLGDERWLRFARWTLATEDDACAAGAALVLYNQGERRLSLIGDAMLRALHDGAYVRAAEITLNDLMDRNGDRSVRWLADHMIKADDFHGAHSGWWRLLLRRIETLQNGPEILAAAAQNLGPYTIPRYPEVREALTRVLRGAKGERFRGALRLRLNSLNPKTRLGAAQILVTAFPTEEADALFVVIRSRANWRRTHWHEWESFCLSLSFGPSVLESLKSRLEELDLHSRAMALVILNKGGHQLTSKHDDELLTGLLLLGGWSLSNDAAAERFLRQPESREKLLLRLKSEDRELRQRAADRLLAFHRAHLTPVQEAHCESLHDRVGWSSDFSRKMIRLLRDAEFAREVIANVRPDGQSLLQVTAAAIAGTREWKDVVWDILCDDSGFSGSSESEAGGMALLEFGFEAADHREAIGKAAKACMMDPRMKQNRWHEAYQWLAVIADAFIGLSKEELQPAILHGQPIGHAVTAGLIARYGSVPENFHCDRGQPKRPQTLPKFAEITCDEKSLLADLSEYSRESEQLHPNLIPTILRSLYCPAIEESALGKFAEKGKPGVAVALALRFVYGRRPRAVEMIPFLDRTARMWSMENNAWLPFARIWGLVRRCAIQDDKPVAAEYLEALDRALESGAVWKLAVAADILEIRDALKDDQIETVFTAYAEHTSFLHERLLADFCDWLSTDVAPSTRKAALAAAKQSVSVLGQENLSVNNGDQPNTWAFLFFPVVVWVFGGKADEDADGVFLRGIRSVFDRSTHTNTTMRLNFSNLLSRLNPLLAKVPPDTASRAIQRGIESSEPSIAAFCRLIGTFAAMTQNSGAR